VDRNIVVRVDHQPAALHRGRECRDRRLVGGAIADGDDRAAAEGFADDRISARGNSEFTKRKPAVSDQLGNGAPDQIPVMKQQDVIGSTHGSATSFKIRVPQPIAPVGLG